MVLVSLVMTVPHPLLKHMMEHKILNGDYIHALFYFIFILLYLHYAGHVQTPFTESGQKMRSMSSISSLLKACISAL